MSSIADMMNGLSDIIAGKPVQAPSPIPKIPDQMIGAPGVFQTPVLGTRWMETAATIPPRIAEIAVTGLPDLANLVQKGIDWVSGTDREEPTTLQTVSDTLHAPFESVTDWVGGGKTNRSLIDGSPPELAASWATLAGAATLRAPEFIVSQVDKGIKALEAGKGIAARTGEYAAKAMEMISPVMVRTPTKMIEAGSVAIPGALGVGLELAYPPPDKQKLDEEAKIGTDIAIAGAEEVSNAVRTTQAGIPSTGSTALDATILGVIGVAGWAAMKRDVLGRVLSGTGKADGDTVLSGRAGFRGNVVDAMTPLKESVRMVHGDPIAPMAPTTANRMANLFDESHGAAIDTKMKFIYQSGEIPNSGIRMPPMTDTFTKIRTLDAPRINAVDGLVNTPKSRWASVGIDPGVRTVASDIDHTAKRMLDYALEQRWISPQARSRLVNESAHDIFVGLSKGEKYLQNMRVNGLKHEDKLIDNLPRYAEDVVRRVEWNRASGSYMQFLRNNADAGDKTAQAILGKRDMKLGSATRDKVYVWRDKNGVLRNDEIKDPVILRALKSGNAPARLHVLGGVFRDLARINESFMTGKLGTILGQPFAHSSAIYNVMFGTAFREPGVRTGLIDAGAQALTKKAFGRPIGMRGDPTFYGVAATKALTGIGAVMAQRLGRSIHAHIVKNGMKAGYASPAALEKAGQAASNMFKRSWVNEFQRRGMLGPTAGDMPNPAQAISVAQSRMKAANVPKRVYNETMGLLEDIIHAVSASPGAAVWSMNKHMDPHMRARAVREFAGDPGRAGAFRGQLKKGEFPGEILGHGIAATPYGNIFIQALDKATRSFARHPVESAVGLATTIGMPTIISALHTMSMGPEYVDYYYNRRNPMRQASSIYVPLPGLPPESGIEIGVEPLSRPFKVAMDILVGTQLGLFDGSAFNPENDDQRHALVEQVRNRWSDIKGVMGEALQQSIIPPTPTAINAGAALAGVKLRGYGDSHDIYKRDDAGFTTSDAKNPNRELFGLKESAVAEEFVRSLGGNSLTMAYNMLMDNAQAVNEGTWNVGDAAKRFMQERSLGTSDAFKQVSPLLFGSFQSISPSQEAAGKLVQEKIKGMEALTGALQDVQKMGALTGGEIVGNKKIGFQELLGGRLAIEPTDPRMYVLSDYAKVQSKQMQMLLAEQKADYMQRNAVQTDTKLSPERKRARANGISNDIIARNRMMLEMMQHFEGVVSNEFGVPVRLDKLNINRGLDQFQ